MHPPPDPTDRLLLRGCLLAKDGAWEAFVARFAPSLAEVCRQALLRSGRPSGPQEVQDMLQEVFLHLWKDDLKALRAFHGKARLASYLSAVAACRVLNDRVLRARRPPPPRRKEAATPLEVLERREEEARLRARMQDMPPRGRLALELQSKGSSLKEVGGALGISEDAAAQLLSRARSALREGLGTGES